MVEEEKEPIKVPSRQDRINANLNEAEAHLKLCEVIPNRNPYDISGEEYYGRTDMFETTTLKQKVAGCKRLALFSQDAYKEASYNNYITPERCKKVMPIAEKYFGIVAPREGESHEKWLERSRLYEHYFAELNKVGLEHMGIQNSPEELFEKCEIIIDLHENLLDMCKIANDNALTLHYTINNRLGDVDIDSGQNVRSIEKICIGFPMVRDLPYHDPQTGEHILTIRVEVNEEPDNMGRVGRIAILEPFPSTIYIGEHVSPEFLWEHLDSDLKCNFWIDRFGFREEQVYSFSSLIGDWDDLDEIAKERITEEFGFLKEMAKEKYKEMKLKEVGSETCVWAAKSQSFKQAEKEAEVIEDKIEAAETFDKKIREYERHIQSYEQLQHGIVDAHPRQTLFDQTISTMAGWIENDLAPVDTNGMPIIDPMLSNMLYNHISQINPRLITKHFLKLLEDLKRQGYTNWRWAEVWLDKFGTVKANLRLSDLEYIHNLTGAPIYEFMEKSHLERIIKSELKDEALVIKKYLELINEGSFWDNIQRERETDELFKKLWDRYVQTIGTIKMRKQIDKYIDLYNLIRNEVRIMKMPYVDLTSEEMWAQQYIEDREATLSDKEDKFKEFVQGARYAVPKTMGLFNQVKVDTKYDFTISVIDHFGDKYVGFSTTNPEEWFCDWHELEGRWHQLSDKEKIDWRIHHTTDDEDDYKDASKEWLERRLKDPNDYIFYNCNCYDYDNSEWNEACCIEMTIDAAGDPVWIKEE